jgi:hypothetical protein
MSIIRQIYDGELFPAESRYSDDPEYLRMRRELESKLSRLNTMLDGDGRQLLEDILSLRMSMDGMGNADMFEAGFRVGAEIMMEVLHKYSQELKCT